MPVSDLLGWVVQGGFAVLFTWLLYDSRREHHAREARLINHLDDLTKAYHALTHEHTRAVFVLNSIWKELRRLGGRKKPGNEHDTQEILIEDKAGGD